MDSDFEEDSSEDENDPTNTAARDEDHDEYEIAKCQRVFFFLLYQPPFFSKKKHCDKRS